MKCAVLCLLVHLSIASGLCAQSAVQFQKLYGSTALDQSYSVMATSDGGFVSVGYTISLGTADILLTKTNSQGELQWLKALGGSSGDFGHQVQETSDGGFIVTGWTASYGAGDDDIMLIKTDAGGVVEWSRTYGRDDTDRGRAVRQTSDGGYIILGHTDGFGLSANDVYLIKTNAIGDTLWVKIYGSIASGAENGWWIEETADGGYIATGNTSEGAGFLQMLLVKFNSDGSVAWSRALGGAGAQTVGNCVKEAANGDFIVTGWTNAFGVEGRDVYATRTSANGTLLWSKTYGGSGNEESQGLVETSAGEIVLGSITSSFGPRGGGTRNGYLLFLDANGDTLSTKAMGGTGDDVVFAIDNTDNGDVILSGWSDSDGAGVADCLLYKTNPGPPVNCDETGAQTFVSSPATDVGATTLTPSAIATPTSVTSTTLSVDQTVDLMETTICLEVISGLGQLENTAWPNFYPNPTTGSFWIALSEAGNDEIAVHVYDLLGRTVYEDQAVRLNAGRALVTMVDIESGQYCVQLTRSDGVRVNSRILIVE